MARKGRRYFKHRSAIETPQPPHTLKDISKEPEAQRLEDLFDRMTDAEKARTIRHLEEEWS